LPWVLLSAQITGKLTSIPFHTMKRVVFRLVIHIDGTDYTILKRDYTTAVKEAIENEACADNWDDITDYVLDNLRTKQ
jgi:hypothetical protein